MKRLIRKASGITLYHGTSAQMLMKIINDGEIGTDMFNTNGGIQQNSVYLTNDKRTARYYGANSVYNSLDSSIPDWVVILEIDVDSNNLQPDMNVLDEDDYDEVPTWEESLNESGQVMHINKIPTSQIVKIYNNIKSNNLSLNNCSYFLDMGLENSVSKITEIFGEETTTDGFIMNWDSLVLKMEEEE